MKGHECARRLGACIVFGCACVLYAAQGHAEWEAIPDISLEAEMNDNPALHSGGEVQFIDEASRLLGELIERELNANVCAAAIEVLAETGTAASLPILEQCAIRFSDEPFLAFAIRTARDRIGSR